MSESTQSTVSIGSDEVSKIIGITKSILANGITEESSKFIILTGGVGSGKTTIRKQKYSTGYVHFDFGEINTSLRKIFDENDPKLTGYTAFASDLILSESLNQKKNIVVEIIGDREDLVKPIIDGMIKKGYKISIEHIHCDPAEAYKRHLKAVDEDPDYLSAYFTQDSTLSFFFDQLGLGAMPKIST